MTRSTVLRATLSSSLICCAACGAQGDPAPSVDAVDVYSGYLVPPESANGVLVVEAHESNRWVEAARISFDEFFREKTVPVTLPAGEVTLRIIQHGGKAAHIDALRLGDRPPAGVLAAKLTHKDFDVVDVPEQPVTFVDVAEGAALSITARVEGERFCARPFKFPKSNYGRPIHESGSFFTYFLDTVSGRLDLDGQLSEVASEEPFFEDIALAGTGHPTSEVYGWVRNDAESLYVAIDFTGDNTVDGDEDYAQVHVNTPHGVESYRVSEPERDWGTPGFAYTHRVGYQHKVYELAIPLARLGVAGSADPLQLAFEVYGTCGGSCCTLPEVEDNSGACCLPSQMDLHNICCPSGQMDAGGYCCPSGQMDAGGNCCEFGVTGGVCNTEPGAIFELKTTGATWGAIVSMNDAAAVGAVGWSYFAPVGLNRATYWPGAGTYSSGKLHLGTWEDEAENLASRIFDINDAGQVCGWRDFDLGSSFAKRAVGIMLIDAGKPYLADTDPAHKIVNGTATYYPNQYEMLILPAGELGEESWATSLNNESPPEIVGNTRAQDDKVHAWIAQDYASDPLPHLESSGSSQVAAINDLGEAVGYSTRKATISTLCTNEYGQTYTCDQVVDVAHPVVWDDSGNVHDLGVQCPGCSAWAHDINDNGWIVGRTKVLGDDRYYNFIHIPDGEPLPPELHTGMNILRFGPSSQSLPDDFAQAYRRTAINEHNQLVGAVRDASGTSHAFLYLPEPDYGLDAGLYFLEDLIDVLSTGENAGLSTHFLRFATEINDAGHIVAWAERRNKSTTSANLYYVILSPSGTTPSSGSPQPRSEDPFHPSVYDLGRTMEDGDPVNTFAGELILREPADLSVGRLRFERTYASAIDQRSTPAVRPFGPGWRHNFQWSLVLASEEVERASVIDPSGSRSEFEKVGSTWQLKHADLPGRVLRQVDEDYEYLLPTSRLRLTFNASGQMTRLSNFDGYTQTLTYDEQQLSTVVDSFGNTLTLTYGTGLVDTLSDGLRAVQFAYDSAGDLVSVTDPLGNITGYAYDDDVQLLAKTLPEQNKPLEQVYDDGRVLEQRDAYQNTSQFVFDHQNVEGATGLVDPLGNTRIHQYNEAAQLLSRSDAAGGVTTYSYDLDGARWQVTDPLGRSEMYFWDDGSGMPESVTDVHGGELVHTYTSYTSDGMTLYDRAKTTYPDGTFDSAAFDRQTGSTKISLTDRAGHTASGTYNALGLLTETVNASGGTTNYTYTNDGRRASITTPAGGTTSTDYELSSTGEVRTITHPGGDQLVLTFDANGNLVKQETIPVNSAAPRVVSHAYDGNGNLESTIDAAGGTATFEYDDMDRVVAMTDPDGHVHRLDYNARGLISKVIDANGLAIGIAYEVRGYPVTLVGPRGDEWTTSYDAVGRVLSRTSPLGHSFSYTYQDTDRQLTVTDPLSRTVTTIHDSMGRVTSQEDNVGGLTCFTYDPRGLLASATLPSATLTEPCQTRTELHPDQAVTGEYVWNELGRISQVVDPNEAVWSYRYDSSGRLQYFDDPLTQTTEYRYDSRGRLQSVSYPDGESREIVYGPYGQPMRQVFSAAGQPDEVVNYTYDANGRTTSFKGGAFEYDLNGDMTMSNGFAIGSDAGGRIHTVTLAPGRVVTYSYDLDQLASVEDWAGGRVAFAYDADGRLTGVTRTNGVTTTYSYNAADQVTEIVEGTLGRSNMSYGADGRVSSIEREYPAMTSVTADSSTTRTVDAASQLVGASYDGRGRIRSDAQRDFVWTASNRLAELTEGGQSVSFIHDGWGHLTERIDGEGSTTYRWNYAHALPCPSERVKGGETTYYVCTPGGDLLYGIDGDDTRRFFHFDEANNTRLLTDDAGALVAAYSYLPYGEVSTSFADGVDNPFTFSGRFGAIQEGSSGLTHMRLRVYDARTQRFLSREPMTPQLHPLLTNPYQYAYGNPVGFGDPLGANPAQSGFSGSTADKAVSTSLTGITYGTFLAEKGTTILGTKWSAEAAALRQGSTAWSAAKGEGLDQLWKKIHATNGVRTAGKQVGTAGDTVGRVVEVYKLVEGAEGVLEQTKQCQALALYVLEVQMDAVVQAQKKGQISPDTAEALVRSTHANFSVTLENCSEIGVIDTLQLSLEAFKNVLAGLCSAPVQLGVGAGELGVGALGNHNPFVIER